MIARRPRPGETEEDLLQEEEELVAKGVLKPSAKLIKPDKRKTDDSTNQSGSNNESVPRSRFGRQQAAKKQKEGIVDNTILKEAVKRSRVPTGVVLGSVVERTVPQGSAQYEWTPSPSPHGFPQPIYINNLTSPSPTPGSRKKSLYMQQLERQGLCKKDNKDVAATSETQTSLNPRLAALGNKSYIVKGSTESKESHEENLAKLSSMSHEEIMAERASLMAELSPEKIAFLRALRNPKATGVKEDHRLSAGEEDRKVGIRLTKENEDEEMPETKARTDDLNIASGSQDSAMEYDDTTSNIKSDAGGRKMVGSEERKDDIETEENEVPESQLPILPSEAKKWCNMGKVEYEKLRWMTDMPAPRPLKNNEGFVARFNFEGDILPYDADVSYRQALHHHGEEAGRAGYTLDEILTLTRSKVLQQRHVGLRTLANILRNTKEGLYDACVNPPVTHLVIEAGGVLLLRFALDDSSHLIYSEAIRALLHLTSSDPDMTCLDLARPWGPASLEPSVASQVHADDKSRQELDKEESELKDFEIVKLDVIRALIRTDTHLRLRYLLETTQPGPETVTNILGVLTRITQHSLAAAWSLASTPRLLKVIIDNFLPLNPSALFTGQSVVTMTTVYGVPLRHALRFIRMLAGKGRELAALLVNTYEIMNRIMIYVNQEPSESSVPVQEALLLSQEAYATWSVFLAYGLAKPVEDVVRFYPLFVKQLIFYHGKVDVNEGTETNKFNYDVGAQMIHTLTRAVNVAASHSLLCGRMKLNQGTLVGADGKSIVLQPPDLTWKDVQDLRELVETCLEKWLVQICRLPQGSFSVLRLIGSCCDFLSSYYVKWKDQVSYCPIDARVKIENLYNKIVSTLAATNFRNFLTFLTPHSSLISSLKPGIERDPINVGSLGCVCFGGEVVPVIRPSSPFPLLLPLSSLLLSLHTLHPALDSSFTTQLLDSQEISDYLVKVCVSPRTLSDQWLTRIETHFITNILQLAALTGVSKRELYHQTSMCIITCVHKGDEHLIKSLLMKVICDPKFVPDLSDFSMGDLSVRDYVPLKSPALSQPSLTPAQLTTTIIQSLPGIGSELSKALVTKREYEASVVLKNGIPFIVNGITISHTNTPLCLETHWPLSPIKHAYRAWQTPPQAQKQEPQEYKSDQSSPEDILTVTRCLQMTYLALKHRRNAVLHSGSHMSWLQHLSLTLLAGNDLFLDPTVSSYLQGCIAEILKQEGYAKLDPRVTIDCFNSVSDWYKRLAEHYMSVSYGDSTFALYLIVPLQQYLPGDLRITLWGDLCDSLQFVFLTPEQVERFIPLKQFHYPAESEEGLIIKYRASLGSGNINARKNAFLHSLASHHAHVYLATKST